MVKTVVIPAAGIGSRLGEFTKNYSKAMCTLGKMPVISHIINNFSDEDNIIILLGYKGDYLKQVIEQCHPSKKITFVNVDNYDKEGSGLGYSLYCAYDLLQRPFLFWSCDTVMPGFNINSCDYNNNWVVYSNENVDTYFNEYRHVEINSNGTVRTISAKDSKKTSNSYNYVGVSYIKDYKDFWKSYNINKDAFIASGEIYGILNILSNTNVISYKCKEWIDCGNKAIFEKYKQIYANEMEETVLEKPDESIWFIDNLVIKFHIDEKFIADRVKRMKLLNTEKHIKNGIILPKLNKYTKNTYSYIREEGIIASSVVTTVMLKDILQKFLDIEHEDIKNDEKISIYKDFYYDKTIKRIKKYCNDNEDIDNGCVINGIHCMPATEIMNKINWEQLALNGVFTHSYHGDFHLENILVNNNKYIMLDWRQNFGKTFVGDIYYDIAKMWHSLIVNHSMVKQNLFTVENTNSNEIKIDIHRTLIDTECEKSLIEYINNSQYDLAQSELLTAIIFLNIAACHIYPYSRFLFYLGKLMINNFYKKHYNNFNIFNN